MLPSLPATVLPCHGQSVAVLLRQRLTSRVRTRLNMNHKLSAPPATQRRREGRRVGGSVCVWEHVVGFVCVVEGSSSV